MREDVTRSVVGSVLLHVLLAGGAVYASNLIERRASGHPVAVDHGVEVDIFRAPEVQPTQPEPERPQETRTPQPSQPQVAAHAPPPSGVRSTHRVLTATGPVAGPPIAVEPNPPAPVGPVEPGLPPTTTPNATGHAPITASDFFPMTPGAVAQIAREAGVDPGHPGDIHRDRNLFAGTDTSISPEQRAHNAAMAPITAALEGSQHMHAAGSNEHDHHVATRAVESFGEIARAVPSLGDAVMRTRAIQLEAPPVDPGSQPLVPGDMVDPSRNQFMGMGGTARIPPPSYHVLRVEIEIDQDPAGTITRSEVVEHSGSVRFDEEALRVMREAIPEFPLHTTYPQRTRYAYEVSDAQGVGAQILGGGNEGWNCCTQAGSHSLRMRVRMVHRRDMRQPAGTPHGPTTGPAPQG